MGKGIISLEKWKENNRKIIIKKDTYEELMQYKDETWDFMLRFLLHYWIDNEKELKRQREENGNHNTQKA